MNEETIIERRPSSNARTENKKESGVWKKVTLGGFSGVLMGAGAMYAGQSLAQETPDADNNAEDSSDVENPAENDIPVANISDGLSFAEAFDQARAEVGPGGVFYWHGGIYNTFSEDEWNAMSDEERSEFAQQVHPEVLPDDMPTPTDAQPDLVAHIPVGSQDDDVEIANVHPTSNEDAGDDVQVVGYGMVDGHVAMGIDLTGNGEADVAFVDVNDNNEIDNQDIITDREGNSVTVGELQGDPSYDTPVTDPNFSNAMENPEVAPDQPDYMNDGLVEA